MTRVAHLTSVHPPRDPRIFHKECRTLASAGYEVALVAPGAQPGTEEGVRFVAYPKVANRFRRLAGNGSRMAKVAETLDADLYHFHDPELLVTGLLLANRGHRVIYDAHEDLAASTSAKQYLPSWSASSVARAAGALERWSSSRMSAVVAATPTIASHFPGVVEVVANYPEAGEWTEAARSTLEEYRNRPPRAVYVGGITEVRNAHEMIAAAGLLRTSDGTLELAGSVHGLPAPEGPGVVYHGLLDRPELIELVSGCRVGVCVLRPTPNAIPSLPTKTFEYMAAGLPVVVSQETTAQAEMVRAERCGLVVPWDSPPAMAEAIDSLLGDPGAAWEMGRRGRAAIEREYSWEPQAERLLDLYGRLLST